MDGAFINYTFIQIYTTLFQLGYKMSIHVNCTDFPNAKKTYENEIPKNDE